MIRWGLLSTAAIAKAALLGAGAHVVAVASRDEGRARAYAAAHGIERFVGSYEALLADPGVDAIYNPLPNALHAEWSVRALEAGKHVLCEKPMGRRPGEVEEAFDVAERAGLVLVEAFFWRHHPQVARALALLASGAIGEPRLVRASFSFPLPDGPSILLRPELDGGSLMDVGCYALHGARVLLGAEPERVYAEQVMDGPDGVELTTAAVLRFPGGVLATIDSSLREAERAELEVVGDDGSLVFLDPWHGLDAVLEVRRDGAVERIALPQADGYALQLAQVEAAIRGEAEPLVSRADSIGQARAIAALFRSAELGAPVAL
jgi:D-xylose 1-dehydrogenase (NADP+, D-xylono-1,5-lactone-forming)